VAALKACKARFKIACITNNMLTEHSPGQATPAQRASGFDEIMAQFDVMIESAKVGLRKPDPAIYLMACERLGVEPAACVYLDDLGINCKPAAKLGMRAIKVVDEAQALRDLAEATGLELEEATA